MIKNTFLAGVCALLSIPALALGQTTETYDRAAQAAAANDPTVHVTFARDLANRCEYRAEIRGTIAPARTKAARSHSGAGEALYDAHLQVRGEVHCPNVAVTRAPSLTVEGNALSASSITQALAQGAVVTTNTDNHRCRYVPSLHMNNSSRPEATGVQWTCDSVATDRSDSID